MSDFQARLQKALDTDFLIERELGGAGMSRVFVATERALQRRVVVKVLPPELAAGVNVERFRREIQLAAQLQHPHIVPLLAAGDDHGLLWFSMPYIEGESLRGSLSRQERLSSRDVVRILHDVVDALAYAHARGIVHRDIKPDNILTSGMHALVTDFGVAKALSAAIPVHGGTTTGMAIGTPAYMAPEQLAADPAADHRVDLYAVGLLAYELLTGRGPFAGTSPQATLAAQLTQMPEPPHRTFSDIPEALSALIMRCLEKDATKRPATATALLAELEALPPMSGATFALARRRRVAPWMLLTGTLGAAAVVWAMVFRPWQPAVGAGIADSLRARDTGPGAGVRSMDIARRDARSNPAVRADSFIVDTIPVFRELGDGAPAVSVPLVITRAESLAIAEAVRKRQAESKPTPTPATALVASSAPGAVTNRDNPGGRVASAQGTASGISGNTRVFVRTTDGGAEIDREALLAEVGRIFADSMLRALKHMDSAMATAPRTMRFTQPRPNVPAVVTPLMAPPHDSRLRVVVTPYTNSTGRRDGASTARDLAEEVRDAIAEERFDVVPREMVDKAMRVLPDKMAVGWALRADYVVSGLLTMRADSVLMITMLTDVRTGRFSKGSEVVVSLTDPSRAFDVARKQVTAWLDTAATLAGKRGGGRGGPTGDLLR
ncbi:MAG: serine/threonine protein kinase [Gemmatimonadaceae bacterium]|nr:serine/threonine protein kinase [Gemmatimonadaceae bacterium]